jgi:hypothetical protein
MGVTPSLVNGRSLVTFHVDAVRQLEHLRPIPTSVGHGQSHFRESRLRNDDSHALEGIARGSVNQRGTAR